MPLILANDMGDEYYVYGDNFSSKANIWIPRWWFQICFCVHPYLGKPPFPELFRYKNFAPFEQQLPKSPLAVHLESELVP